MTPICNCRLEMAVILPAESAKLAEEIGLARLSTLDDVADSVRL
jgi:hypothetical protein